VNFARSSILFVALGLPALFFGGRTNAIGLVGLFSIGIGVFLGLLSLIGLGRPVNQPYKAPWIALSLGWVTLLIFGRAALSDSARAKAQADPPVTESPAAEDAAASAFVDKINGFRLDNPGKGWKLLSTTELRAFNEAAATGAQIGPDLGGFVFVETLEPGFRIAGNEQEVGRLMIDQIEVDDKRVVFSRPDELERQKAVRCQVVGKINGRGIRYEVVTLTANGRLYRLTALGPSDQTSEDGLAFRPFMDAFHLLPTNPPSQ
jgi:hypothetical protein